MLDPDKNKRKDRQRLLPPLGRVRKTSGWGGEKKTLKAKISKRLSKEKGGRKLK